MSVPLSFDPRDDALLLQVGQGNGRALFLLYDRLSAPLYTVAVRMLGNPDDASHLLEEVFLDIWQKASGFQPEKSSAWIWTLRLVRTRALDHLRSRPVSLDLPEERTSKEKNSGQPVELPEEFLQSAKSFKAAWNQLQEIHQEAVQLAYFQGFTLAQLSDYLEEPFGAVKNRAYRGLARLREALRSYHG